jgi:hypothetical protein
MKKNLLFIILLIQSNFLFSQIEILDKKNGFKTLIFGTSVEDFNIPKNEISKEHELILYKTSNSDLKKVFNTKMDDLFLSFVNHKLSGIVLIKEYNSPLGFDESLADHERITNNFTSVLGKYTNVIDDETGFGPAWVSENVNLLITLHIEDITTNDNDDLNFKSKLKIMFITAAKNKSNALQDGF